jgi:hypothetical protein
MSAIGVLFANLNVVEVGEIDGPEIILLDFFTEISDSNKLLLNAIFCVVNINIMTQMIDANDDLYLYPIMHPTGSSINVLFRHYSFMFRLKTVAWKNWAQWHFQRAIIVRNRR